MSTPVTIIGGGIAGLATAYYLNRNGGFSCTLIESESRLGGTIQTLHEHGYTVEAGPDSIITTRPAGTELVKEVDLEPEIIQPLSRRFFIFHAGRLRPVPAGFASLAPASPRDIFTSDLLSLKGKLRVLSEPFRKRVAHADDESVRSFFERRLGAEFTRLLAEPLFAGIHAGQGDKLSMRALLPHFLQMERKYGSLARAIKARRNPTSAATPPPVFVSLKRGMESLVEAITGNLSGVTVQTDTEAKSITAGEDGSYTVTLANGAALVSRHLVIATRAPVTATLLQTLDQEVARRLRDIPYASTAAVTLAMDATDIDHALDGTGCLIPGELQMTACTWSSRKWAGRAPDGKALFRCFYGRHDDDDALTLDDQALIALAHTELSQIIPIRGQPGRAWVHRWQKTMPQYIIGHLDNIAAIENRLGRYAGIHLVGSAYRGVGIPDCIRQARELAESIAGTIVSH